MKVGLKVCDKSDLKIFLLSGMFVVLIGHTVSEIGFRQCFKPVLKLVNYFWVNSDVSAA